MDKRLSSRLFLVFALAFTVPFQAFAATIMADCDELEQRVDMVVHDDGHHHGSAATHDHGKPDSLGDGGSHCPPCGASAAITAFSRMLLPEAASATVVDRLPLPISGVMPERLDRPPLFL
jgi:hypothetical protein